MDKLMVLDGDFEAQLRRHLDIRGKPNPAFALQALKSNQQAVYETHMDFLRAGAQIIRTNTYRASVRALKSHLHIDSDEDALYYIREAAMSAKSAAYDFYVEEDMYTCPLQRALVAGSCGTVDSDYIYGIPNTFDSVKEYMSFHESRAKKLIDAGVDLLAFESISSRKETSAIILLLQKYSTTRAWITFSCFEDGTLRDGNKIPTVAELCYTLKDQIIALGIECDSPNTIKFLIRNIHRSNTSKVPFVFYCNKQHFSTIENNAATSFSLQQNYVNQWLDIGVRYIGGSTNVVAEDIKNIRKQVNNYRNLSDKIFAPLVCSYQCNKKLSKI